MNMIIQVVLLLVGFVLLIKGADWFVEGASKIADHFHIPQLVIGLTIVAFGTSAPEAAISITAALKGNADITIGNVLGSNILNVLVIVGITAIIIPLAVQKSTLKYEVPFVVFVSIVLLVLGRIGNEISFFDATILMALFLVFFVYLIWIARKGEANQNEEQVVQVAQNENIIKMIIITIIGMAAIIIGSDITVDSATVIAKAAGLSERFIGLTIIAFGTSLPELITSVTAGIKGKDDIAIGNIVGSNIFNILFVIGITGFITPVPFASNFIIDGVVCIIAAAFLLYSVINDKKVDRKEGICMLVAYTAYFIYLIF